MIRHLIPRAEWGGWSGAALTRDERGPDDANGWCICIQWLGFIVEIGAGRVR